MTQKKQESNPSTNLNKDSHKNRIPTYNRNNKKKQKTKQNKTKNKAKQNKTKKKTKNQKQQQKKNSYNTPRYIPKGNSILPP